MNRPYCDRNPPHDRVVMQDEPPTLSAWAAMFLPDPERPQYDNGIEPNEAVRAACARVRAKTEGSR